LACSWPDGERLDATSGATAGSPFAAAEWRRSAADRSEVHRSMTDNHWYAERNWPWTRAKRQLFWAVVRKLMAWRILRIRNGHYYSPVPSLRELKRDAARVFDRSRRSLPGIDLYEDEQLALVERLATFYGEQPFGEAPRAGIRYFFDNDWFGRADALFLYSIIRLFRPHRIVEIGSGFSSAVMLDTNERFMQRSMRLTFIEPDSARLRKLLTQEDRSSVSIVEQRVQDLERDIVDQLGANDILFVDSSHVLKAGSDVNHILFELLPRLKSGVLVQFHDVLYPFEYPLKWFQQGLSWNESHALRAFLQYNSQFQILFWNDFVVTFHNEAIRQLMPLCAEPPGYGVGGSLWLRRT
jgi:predicted O-methyltransferase YrrM